MEVLHVMRCVIWHHLYNKKREKDPWTSVNFSKVPLTLLHGCFSRFFNCTNGTKSRNAPHSTREADSYQALVHS